MITCNKDSNIRRLLLTAVISCLVICFHKPPIQLTKPVEKPVIHAITSIVVPPTVAITPIVAPAPVATFDPLKPETWPKCADNQYVRADNGQCDEKPVSSPKISPTAVSSGNCEQYRPLVAQYGWNVSVAMAVMQAESGCNANAVSPPNYDGLRDNGLFQLHGMAIYDPAENIRVAYQVKYLTQGWGAWTVYKTGAYIKYLK